MSLSRNALALFLYAALALAGCPGAIAGGIPPAPPFDFVVPTPTADYQVQSVSNPLSPHYFPPLKIISAALSIDNAGVPSFGNPNGYHAGYVGRGFRQPFFTDGNRLVQFYDCKTADPDDSDCDNGFATTGRILMPVSVYTGGSPSCIRGILGHELFHHIEFAYADAAGSSGCSGWMGSAACEGQARSLQDKIYIDLDLDPTASCVAPYDSQVDSFLGAPNQNLWTVGKGYGSALWWTYLSEQYGTINVEPHRGIDFFVQFWENAEADGENPDVIAVTDATIKDFAPTHHVQAAFHNFIIANIAKDLDLSGTSASFRNRYSYRDEEPILLLDNQMEYAEVPRTSLVVPVDGTRQSSFIALPYGSVYQDWDVSSCPAGGVIRFETDPGENFLGNPYYTITGVLTVRGDEPGVPVSIYKNRSTGWSTQIVQPFNRYDRLLSVVAGWSTLTFGNLRVSCASPPSLPQFPLLSPINPFTPGPPDTFAIGQVSVDVVDPVTPRDPGLRELTPDQFVVEVGGQPAEVLAALRRDARYDLQLRFPPQAAPGTYPISVQLGDDLVSVADGVSYGTLQPQLLLAIDTSSSMLLPPNGTTLDALQRSSRRLLAALPPHLNVGLIEHFGNNSEPDDDAFVLVPLGVLDDTQRNRIDVAIQSRSSGPSRTSGMGDAIRVAIGEFEARATPRQARHLVLLSDGPENEADFWVDLEDDTIAAGVAVHTIALGRLADQPLLDRIARRTGGSYHYVDIGSSVDEAEMNAVFARVADLALRRSRLADTTLAPLSPTTPVAIKVYICPADCLPSADTVHFSVDAAGSGVETLGNVRVFDPDGVERIDGVDATRVIRGLRYFSLSDRSMPGEWRVEVTGTSVAGNTPHSLRVSADQHGNAAIRTQVSRDPGNPESSDDFSIGDPVAVQIALLIPAVQKVREAAARMQHPDGSSQLIRLNDDGERGDVLADDNVWSGRYRRLTAASPTGFPDTPGFPPVRGSYSIDAVASIESTAAVPPRGAVDERGLMPQVQLVYQKISFSVLDTGTLPDGDNDQMPDRYERNYRCLDAAVPDGSMDADQDGRASFLEFQDGTDPCNPDSDAGGETDESERLAGRDPLDPSDDAVCPMLLSQIESPEHEHEEYPEPPANAIKLRFSTCARNTAIEVRRALQPEGPFQLIATIDPRVERGTWWDRNLVAGTSYWYQLVPHNGSSVGAPGDVFGARAKLDPESPLGSVIINDGRPRTDDPRLQLRVSLYNKPEATTQMRVAVNGGAPGPWQSFARSLAVDVQPVLEPTDMRVSVELRDDEQDVSTPLIDGIRLYPISSLGSLRARIVAPGTQQPWAGVMFWLVGEETEANGITDANGDASLLDLKPGDYVIRFDAADGTTMQRSIRIDAGQFINLGDLVLVGVPEIFRDGFE